MLRTFSPSSRSPFRAALDRVRSRAAHAGRPAAAATDTTVWVASSQIRPTATPRVAAAMAFLLVASLVGVGPARAADGVIAGVAFQDMDRDGVHAEGEGTFDGHRIYLYAADGTYLRNATTDADGRYAFTGLPDGRYEVRYAAGSWWEVRDDWVPTTTESLRPQVAVDVTGPTTVDFGWRPIVTSTDLAEPVSEHVGDDGLTVQSYTDAVDATEIYDAVTDGLVGDEASSVTVRFAYGSSSATNGTIVHDGEAYASYRAVAYVSYASWLDGGDRTLSHEYGHAWSEYHAYLTQQDPELTDYLEVRGLAGDDRVDSSYAWSRWEMIAEDYRQLFGSDDARRGGRLNGSEIDDAWDVPGLEAYLRDVFTQPADTDADEELPDEDATDVDDPGDTTGGDDPDDATDDGSVGDGSDDTDGDPDGEPDPSTDEPESQTTEVSGNLNGNHTSRSHDLQVGAGEATATLEISRVDQMTLTVLDASGAVVATMTGPGGTALTFPVLASTYTVVVSAERGSYTVTVDHPAPAQASGSDTTSQRTKPGRGNGR